MKIDGREHELPKNAVCLIAIIDGMESDVFPLEEGENLLGRWDPDTLSFPEVDLTSVDAEVKISRKHATIDRDGDELILRDGGSRNGTFLKDGTRLNPGESHQLHDGVEFSLGKVRLRVKVG